MKFYEELLPLEAQLPDLRPTEGVYPRVVLEDNDAHVRDSQVKWNALVILKKNLIRKCMLLGNNNQHFSNVASI